MVVGLSRCSPATYLLGAVSEEVKWCYCAVSIMLGFGSDLIFVYIEPKMQPTLERALRSFCGLSGLVALLERSSFRDPRRRVGSQSGPCGP